MRTTVRRILGATAWCTSTAALGALALRITIADATPLAAWVFYFVPLPLVALSLVTACVLFAGAMQSRSALAMLVAAAATYGFWIFAYTYDAPCAPATSGSVRVLSWNVDRLRGGIDAVAERIAAADADVIGLVEASHPSEKHLAFWRSRFPSHTVLIPGGGLVLMVRGAVTATETRELIGISRLLAADVEMGGTPLRIVLADLDASPNFDKRTLLERTFEAAIGARDGPALIMGDFNTPIESRWFRGVRGRYAHAFEQAGSGLLATWPASRPLVAIDHIWAGGGLSAVCARLEATPVSDHSMFHAVLRVASIQPPAAPRL